MPERPRKFAHDSHQSPGEDFRQSSAKQILPAHLTGWCRNDRSRYCATYSLCVHRHCSPKCGVEPRPVRGCPVRHRHYTIDRGCECNGLVATIKGFTRFSCFSTSSRSTFRPGPCPDAPALRLPAKHYGKHRAGLCHTPAVHFKRHCRRDNYVSPIASDFHM